MAEGMKATKCELLDRLGLQLCDWADLGAGPLRITLAGELITVCCGGNSITDAVASAANRNVRTKPPEEFFSTFGSLLLRKPQAYRPREVMRLRNF